MNIGDLFQNRPELRSFKEHPDIFNNSMLTGIEVEAEGVGHYHRALDDTLWSVKHDDSLRVQGCEFVLSVPLAGYDLYTAIEDLGMYLKGMNHIVSPRTSVHVHIDVRHWLAEHIHNLQVVYTILEESIFRTFAPERWGNIYCLPYRDSSLNLRTFSDENWDSIIQNVHEASKYSALNFQATMHYGSVEFRQHGGWVSTEDTLKWVDFLHRMCTYASTTPRLDTRELLLNTSTMGPLVWLEETLGPEVVECLSVSTLASEIRRGVRDVQSKTASKEVISSMRLETMNADVYENSYTIGAK